MDDPPLGHGDVPMTAILFRIGRSLRRPGTRLIAGLVLFAILGLGPVTYGAITSGVRTDHAVTAAAAVHSRVNLKIILGFRAQNFNIRFLRGFGEIGAVTDTYVELRDVNPVTLGQLSRTEWISRIELLNS
jgi:hypothetical protein